MFSSSIITGSSAVVQAAPVSPYLPLTAAIVSLAVVGVIAVFNKAGFIRG